MSDDFVQVYIEDHRGFGPAAYPVELAKYSDLLEGGIVMLRREQAERWASAERQWAIAQAEMKQLLEMRQREKAAALAGATDYESAHRMFTRSDGRRRRP